MRREHICRASAPRTALAPGVDLLPLASQACGAEALCTSLVDFSPGTVLPAHVHPCAEAIVVLDGEVEVLVMRRRYSLGRLDALHLPAGRPHSLRCDRPARLFSAFASSAPSRHWIDPSAEELDGEKLPNATPERLTRFTLADEYELAPGAMFRDLFVGSADCRGICGGYGLFEPGASLPCHTHAFDESITIIQGRAACRVAGRKHIVECCDTALVPRGLPHRFINEASQPMAMIWVYAGDRPERTIVSQCLCDDSLQTPAACDISAGQISYG